MFRLIMRIMNFIASRFPQDKNRKHTVHFWPICFRYFSNIYFPQISQKQSELSKHLIDEAIPNTTTQYILVSNKKRKSK